jgi:chloride channel protein, CIC family
MEHIVPPRDLQGWQNLPVSAIAHFDPVVAQGLELSALHEIMKHSYSRFPVVERGCLVGMLRGACHGLAPHSPCVRGKRFAKSSTC